MTLLFAKWTLHGGQDNCINEAHDAVADQYGRGKKRGREKERIRERGSQKSREKGRERELEKGGKREN